MPDFFLSDTRVLASIYRSLGIKSYLLLLALLLFIQKDAEVGLLNYQKAITILECYIYKYILGRCILFIKASAYQKLLHSLISMYLPTTLYYIFWYYKFS